MKGLQEEYRDESVFAHYGMSRAKANLKGKEILCDLISFELVSDVIDKHFEKFNAEERAKILCFCLAFLDFQKLK